MGLLENNDGSPLARLAEAMSEISEEAWSAGWSIGLEFWIWDLIQGHAGLEACFNPEADLYTHMVALVDRCRDLHRESGGCWVVWDEDRGVVAVGPDEWARMLLDRPA